jgi:regulator of replication initiation timing
MNNEELIKENLLLREENEKLKKQLENYVCTKTSIE